jgi:acetyl esterase/lipase
VDDLRASPGSPAFAAAGRPRRPLVRAQLHRVRRGAAILAALALSGCLVGDPGAGAGAGWPEPGGHAVATFRYDAGNGLDLDLYTPTGPLAAHPPVIVALHGGSWTVGTRRTVAAPVLAQLRRGFVVASVDYRSAFTDPFPAAVLDVKRAIRWLQATPRLAGSPVVVVGSSAGGNLAVMAAVSGGVAALEPVPGRATVVQGAVSLDGPQDLRALQQPPWLGQTWPMDELGPGPERDHYGGRIESGDLVPVYLGCAATAICPQLTGPAIAAASTPSWIDAGDPPLYLACLAANLLLADCAHDAGPFAAAYVQAHGGDRSRAWVDQLTQPGATHFTVDTHLNGAALERFLDWVSLDSVSDRSGVAGESP